MPANKMTQQEAEFFPDVAHGSQSAMLEFLYIRNRLLQMWINNPGSELTAEKAQNTVVLPQSGQGRAYVCIHKCEREGEREGGRERVREKQKEREINSQT
jgi:lysine-specific histone demethylase 1